MKKSTIKLFCIFIIIMYCLVPIGAIDLNHDSNASLKNLNDTTNETSIDINNDTTDDVPIDISNDTSSDIPNDTTDDIPIDISNDTSSDIPNDTTKEISIDTTNDTILDVPNETTTNESLKDSGYEMFDFDMKIDDILYGQKPVAKVHTCLPNYSPGDWINPFEGDIDFLCPAFSKSHRQEIKCHNFHKEETNNYEIDENLKPGIYSVHAQYYPAERYCPWRPNQCWATFKVRDNIDADLNVQIDNMTQGDKLKIKINANEALNDMVEVKIKDVGTYHIQVKNGVAEKTFNTVKLAPGNYTATATNEKGYSCKKEVKTIAFTVKEDLNPKIKPYLSVHVDNVLEGDDAKVKISANETFNAPVKLDIKSTNDTMESTVNVANGVGETSISDLSPGTYAALVTFDGNDKFKEAVNSTGFTVKKRDEPELSIFVENNTIAGKTDIEVGGNPNLANPVKIKLNNSEEYSLKLEKGSGTLTIDDLASGDYTATVTYDGDNDYKRGEVSTQFTKKGNVDPKFQIHINETLPGYEPVAEIKCNTSFNGKVDISCPQFQQGYEAEIKDGHALVRFDKETDLAEGSYTVSLKYDGDYTFMPTETSTSFKVAKTTPNLSMDAGAGGYSGSTAMIYIKANKLMNDDVKVKIKSGNYEAEETVKVVDGEGKVSFGGLNPGTYSATVNFDGNKILEKGSANTSFIIQRHL